MRVKISWDDGASFQRECALEDCIQKFWDAETFADAERELTRHGRYWLGGGSAPLALLVRA